MITTEYRLGEVCSRLSSGKNIKASQIFEKGSYPVFGGNGIRGYTDTFNFDGECAIIGRQGAYCGNVQFYKGRAYMTEHAVVVCGNEKSSTKFLGLVLQKMDLGRLSHQAAQPGLSVKVLAEQKVILPPIGVQTRIAQILTAYDDLIENNQKQIKLLEEAAQRLYKEWFVDLRFPGHETTPIVDGIPEGWEKEKVGMCVAKIARTKQVMTADMLECGEIPVVDQSRDFVAGYTNDTETIVDLGVPVIVFGDHTRVLKYIQFPFAKGADGTQLIVSNNERMPQSLFYCCLVNVDLSNHHYARHFKYLKAEEILLPTQDIACKFDSIVALLFKQVQRLRDKCTLAAEACDRLLPKLMSGEIEV